MCEVYWTEGMPGKVRDGEWREEVRDKSSDAATFEPFEDYCGNWIVATQELVFIDNKTNEERARLHRYITDEGTVGGSGNPEPKRIRLADGRKFNLTKKSKAQKCAVCGRVGHDWPKDTPGFRTTLTS